MVHGHEHELLWLRRFLPRAALFHGPHSVGRWTVAEHLRYHHSIDESDVLRFHELDVEDVRTIQQFFLTAPVKSKYKLVIVDLYKASRGAQVALTSVLENTYGNRIIVIAQSSEVLPGVRSRCTEFFFHYLSSDDVAQILIEKMNFSPERAHVLAARAGGTVYGALKLADGDETITLVRQALRALRVRDEDALSELAVKWTDEATAWLVLWCQETISGQWRVFDHEDYVAGRALPLKILIALRDRVRPRLVVRSQLMSVLRGE